MCQILALSANSPTDISFSFEGFVNRAGITDSNVDGTGIAFFEEDGVRILKDEHRAVDSYVRNLVRIYQIKSKNIIAHIRRASQGKSQLENCHPFVRELWGENWVFAHNGHVWDFSQVAASTYKQQIGTTDSELFFLHIINTLAQRFAQRPTPSELFQAIKEITDSFATAGILNFVLSNGTYMIAHCSTNLYWLTRDATQDNFARRLDDGGVINLSCYANSSDIVSIICTMPITDEYWNKLDNGQLIMFENGEIIHNEQGIPSVIDERYEQLTGINASVKQEIDEQQSRYALDACSTGVTHEYLYI